MSLRPKRCGIQKHLFRICFICSCHSLKKKKEVLGRGGQKRKNKMKMDVGRKENFKHSKAVSGCGSVGRGVASNTGREWPILKKNNGNFLRKWNVHLTKVNSKLCQLARKMLINISSPNLVTLTIGS